MMEELEYERDVTNRELSTVIHNFKGFQESFSKRRQVDKREAAGESVESKKELGVTMEQMILNQEQLRDEMEIEIAYEETRRKELDSRYAQFIKTLDFMVATRLCNITV